MNPTAAAPISQEPMRRSLSAAVGTARSAVMLVISFISLRPFKTTLVNVFRDQVRKRSRTVDERPMGDLSDFSLYRTLVDEDPFPYSDSLHTDFLQVFDSEDLREVLIRLPDIYRIPLVLRYMD